MGTGRLAIASAASTALLAVALNATRGALTSVADAHVVAPVVTRARADALNASASPREHRLPIAPTFAEPAAESAASSEAASERAVLGAALRASFFATPAGAAHVPGVTPARARLDAYAATTLRLSAPALPEPPLAVSAVTGLAALACARAWRRRAR